MPPDLRHDTLGRSGPCPRIDTAQKHRGHGPLLQGHKQRGFGLVAAMFLIIVIAGVIAAMWRMSVTQTATNTLSLQQARAYQAARAGIEWGISSALAGTCSEVNLPFTPDGFAGLFRIDVSCSEEAGPPDLSEEGIQNLVFYTITSEAEYASVGSPDHAYRQLQAVVERAEEAEQGSETGED